MNPNFLELHPWVRTAIRVFVYTFITTFALALTGFLGDVAEWATRDDLPFPDVSVLGKAAVAAVSGAVSAALAVIWNVIPITKSAVYVNPPAGDVDPVAVVEPPHD